METRTLSIDGLAATSSPPREEVVLFDRAKHSSEPKRSQNSLDSLQPRRRTAKTDTKLRATKAKQRGWDVVAQARLDAKHRDRHNQRHAAKKAAHHHRQRHDIDNYAQAHTSSLELDDAMNRIKPNQSKVSVGLHISNLFQSHTMKFAGFGMMVLAIVGGAVLFTGSTTSQTTTQSIGEVQAITTTNTIRSEPVQPIEQRNESVQSSQVASPDSDGNLDLWTSTLE